MQTFTLHIQYRNGEAEARSGLTMQKADSLFAYYFNRFHPKKPVQNVFVVKEIQYAN
jgi:hypothetical protein